MGIAVFEVARFLEIVICLTDLLPQNLCTFLHQNPRNRQDSFKSGAKVFEVVSWNTQPLKIKRGLACKCPVGVVGQEKLVGVVQIMDRDKKRVGA